MAKFDANKKKKTGGRPIAPHLTVSSPFAIKEDVRVYLDESLRRFATIYPACGSGASAIGLTCAELEQHAQNFTGWVDLCKGWQEEVEG